MGRVFIAAHSAPGAARSIRRLSARTDVYAGVALRTRADGGRDAIDLSHLAFVEIDAPTAIERLAGFPHQPSMVITSGTRGHAHAYWTLRTPVRVPEIERANRRLAHHLGGDLASVDAARILRPPASRNHKHSPPTPVELVKLDPARRYEIGELVEGLADPRDARSSAAATRTRSGSSEIDRALLAIPAADYVRILVGRSPNRAGKIPCPFHDDRTPSFQLYDDGTWYCFGACQAGGSIYDFAARLWLTGQCSDGRNGGKLRGRQYLWVRQRLVDIFIRDQRHDQASSVDRLG